MTKKNSKQPYYSEEYKLKIVKEVISSGKSINSIREKYGISGRWTIKKWLIKYNLTTPINQKKPLALPSMKDLTEKQTLLCEKQRLEKKKIALEKQMQKLRLQVEGYEIMLDIAKKEHNLDLRKKHGVKQSKR